MEFSRRKKGQLPLIIAEVKTGSPFGYAAEASWDELFELAASVGDVISIHTDARWGGSMELIAAARAKTDKPILAKGIHAEDELLEQALAAGADMALVVGRVPQMEGVFLVEPLTLDELSSYPQNVLAVWNSRDLATGGLKSETFDDARKVFGGWLCQASNIRTVDDIHPLADAVLVGTHLKEFAESVKSSSFI